MLLDAEHVLVGGIGDFRIRHNPACDNRGVSGVFHAAEVRVLHGNFPVHLIGILVTADQIRRKSGNLFAQPCLAAEPPGTEFIEFLPRFGILEAFRTGEDMRPENRIRHDVDRGFCVVFIRTRQCQQFEADGFSIRIAEVLCKGVPGSNSQEEQVRRHWLIVLIGDGIPCGIKAGSFAGYISVGD